MRRDPPTAAVSWSLSEDVSLLTLSGRLGTAAGAADTDPGLPGAPALEGVGAALRGVFTGVGGRASSSLSEESVSLELSAAGAAVTAGVFLVGEPAPTGLVLEAAAGCRAPGAVVAAGVFLAAAPSSLSSLDSVLEAAEGWALLGPGATGVGVLVAVETALRGVLGVVGGASSSLSEDSVSLELSAAGAGAAAAGGAFLLADGVAACWFPGSDSSSLSEDVSLLSLSGFLAPAAGVLAAGDLAGVAAPTGVFLVEEAATTGLALDAGGAGAGGVGLVGVVVVAFCICSAAPSSLSSLDSLLDGAGGLDLGPVAVFTGAFTALVVVVGLTGGFFFCSF